MSFELFNLIEGLFWLMCGAGALYMSGHVPSKQFWVSLSVTFALFGISDFVEAVYPLSFLEKGALWLLVWKVLCAVSLIVHALWYLYKRRVD